MTANNGYTPTEARIVEVLSDGMPHPMRELVACLWDADQGDASNVHPHLTAIRSHLRPKGEDILCQMVNRRLMYRHVRLISARE